MPVASSDVLLKFSVKTGAAGNSTAGTPAGSLGKYISTTEIVDNTLHNLFDVISGTENADSDVEYRCIFVHNNHGSINWQNVVAFLAAEGTGGANIAIGVDPIAASAISSASAQAEEVIDEGTAPDGVVFTSPTTQGAGVALGTINAGQCKAIWIRRSATNSGAVAGDSVSLRFVGESL